MFKKRVLSLKTAIFSQKYFKKKNVLFKQIKHLNKFPLRKINRNMELFLQNKTKPEDNRPEIMVFWRNNLFLTNFDFDENCNFQLKARFLAVISIF